MSGDVTVENVNAFVMHLHNGDYVQRKRGYGLKKATPTMSGIHLVEESAEFAAACMAPEGLKLADKDKPRYIMLLEESADVLACWLHLNYIMGLPLGEVTKSAIKKLDDIFVLPSDPRNR